MKRECADSITLRIRVNSLVVTKKEFFGRHNTADAIPIQKITTAYESVSLRPIRGARGAAGAADSLAVGPARLHGQGQDRDRARRSREPRRADHADVRGRAWLARAGGRGRAGLSRFASDRAVADGHFRRELWRSRRD